MQMAHNIGQESPIIVGLKQLPHGLDLPLPSYGTSLSSGLDLYAAVDKDIILEPQQWQAIPSGIAIALPRGYEAQIRSRSGLAIKHGVVILNSPGTVDADYRGEILGILINHGSEPFTITRGMRFAQMIITKFDKIVWEVKESLDETSRGVDGFGSTGLR
jgi:dUTP pyrophosphatase